MPARVRAAVLFTASLVMTAAGLPGAAATGRHGRPFGGLPYVGALFRADGGQPQAHFCTAAVLRSPAGNLVITSAHCMAGRAPAGVAFAAGYHDGRFPRGLDPVARVYTDHAWAARRSINDDVAVLRLRTGIQRQTGALSLATGHPPATTRVIGYPDGRSRPVECTTRAAWFRTGRQMRFACGGYPDGTSGGPWILGRGRVYGVIGGYQQGGRKPWISYSPAFGRSVRALYRRAVAQDH